ncbi:MarR family winged helix-turn-helix transcriptional regulator [Mycolicibacter icosiumassiliensis]|uniref:MarR family winged helix-turn-helix transcriptional regulator n=1 Tax=Mycolicibacter icosiumassiliensis TaxID=1792835 RepID=UPI00082E6321|nr:MarR family transcriptional regulator [Mycolicibacter icosiumassiliensis]
MACFLPGRTGVPKLDLAEHKSWQHYLATVLHMTTLLNRELLDAHQLSLADLQLLDLLDTSPAGSVQMGELPEALDSLPSRLTRQIKKLEERGLVQRTLDPHDRRRVMATITATGKTLLEQTLITYTNAVRTHFLGPLTRPQIAAMATTCRQIGDGLKGPGRP